MLEDGLVIGLGLITGLGFGFGLVGREVANKKYHYFKLNLTIRPLPCGDFSLSLVLGLEGRTCFFSIIHNIKLIYIQQSYFLM